MEMTKGNGRATAAYRLQRHALAAMKI